MKVAVQSSAQDCHSCIACLKACSMDAITIEDGSIKIDEERCINCMECIEHCKEQKLTVTSAKLMAIADYGYTICLVPSALSQHCIDNIELSKLLKTVKDLGFDEVHEISYFEGIAHQNFLKEKGDLRIASFCPVVNSLIRHNFPVLMKELSDIDYPSEIAARYYRKKHKDKEIGIFLLCECGAKLTLGKHPYDNLEYEVDHCLAIRDIFPLIQLKLRESEKEVIPFEEGLSLANINSLSKENRYLAVDGLKKVCSVLERAELGGLKDFDHAYLYPCFNGCIGGDLLWGNPYSCMHNYQTIQTQEVKEVKEIELYAKRDKEEILLPSFKERLVFFEKVMKVKEQLPGYDCSACGYPSCKALAEAIVKEKDGVDIHKCRVLRAINWREHGSK